MKTLAEYTVEERAERLRTWAKGSLPMMAAVEFLIGSEALAKMPGGFVKVEENGWMWLDRHEISDALESGDLGYLSGGEQATWQLVSSMLSGELSNTYWRLDPERKAAFIRAWGVS